MTPAETPAEVLDREVVVHPDAATVRVLLILVRRAEGDGVRIQHPLGDVWVYVLSADRGRVSLGFKAPVGVGIHREELLKEGSR